MGDKNSLQRLLKMALQFSAAEVFLIIVCVFLFYGCRAFKVEIYERGVPSCHTPSGGISIKDFPHIAVLGYRYPDEERYHWDCRGSLLNSRYVLTATSCKNEMNYLPTKVRLGVITVNYVENAKSSDYDIVNLISHPVYNIDNNIVLIKLSRKVKFSENVGPICLPERESSSSIMYQVNYQSTILKDPKERPLTKYKMIFPIKQDCNKLRSKENHRYSPLGLIDDLLCLTKVSNVTDNYGAFIEAGTPIYSDQQVPFINTVTQVAYTHVLLGIVSFKILSDRLSVTKVYPFLEWIDNTIWADEENFV